MTLLHSTGRCAMKALSLRGRFLCASIVLALVAPGCGPGPSGSAPPPGAPTADPPSAPQPPPPRLSEEMERVPTKYAADDIEELHADLQKQARSEFEKATEFAARRKTIAGRAIVVVSDSLAVSYDADSETATAKLMVNSHYQADDDPALLVVRHARRQLRQEPRSNAFGVRVDVAVIQDDTFGLAISPVPSATWRNRIAWEMGVGRFIPVTFKATPQEARSLVDTGVIKAIFFTSPSARTKTLVDSRRDVSKATISSPEEVTLDAYGVYVDTSDVRVWLLNSRTGDVMARTSIGALLGMAGGRRGSRQ